MGTGDVQIVADANYQENGLIYAANDAPDRGIWRWAIGLSTTWEPIDRSVTALMTGQRIGGLAMGSEGTLYALRLEPASASSGGMTRSLNPADPYVAEIEFAFINRALPGGTTFDPNTVFPNTLPCLKLSGGSGQDELWTIDTANEIVYRFQDSLSRLGPRLQYPTSGDIIPVTTPDGGINIPLSWEALPWATEYEAAIYLDPDCTQRAWSGISATASLLATGDHKLPRSGPGTTCYWRVRATEPVESPWSEIWSFTTTTLGEAYPSPLAPLAPALGVNNIPLRPVFNWGAAAGATGYEFVLARDAEFTDVVTAMTGADALPTTAWGCDTNLEYATTYCWKVRAVSANSHSEWETGVFITIAKPPAEQPVVVPPAIVVPPVITVPPTPPVMTVQPPSAPSPSRMPWVAIAVSGIGLALVIALLALVVRSRI